MRRRAQCAGGSAVLARAAYVAVFRLVQASVRVYVQAACAFTLQIGRAREDRPLLRARTHVSSHEYIRHRQRSLTSFIALAAKKATWLASPIATFKVACRRSVGQGGVGKRAADGVPVWARPGRSERTRVSSAPRLRRQRRGVW